MGRARGGVGGCKDPTQMAGSVLSGHEVHMYPVQWANNLLKGLESQMCADSE